MKPQRRTKKPSGTGEQRKRLEAELKEAIRQIDEEGLLFLLQQAHILVHNAQVDKLNEELAELRQKKPARRTDARQKPAREQVSIDEAEGGKAFFLTLGGVRKVMDLEEMRRLVRICYAAESKSAALKQMYTVFARERSDVLADAGIAGPTSPILDALFYAVRSRYSLKEE